MTSRSHLVASACALCLLSAGWAGAQPSVWQLAGDPRRGVAHRVLVRAERAWRALNSETMPPGRLWMQRKQLVALLASSEPALPDPRLRFMLGALMAKPPEDDHAEARRLLQQALAEDAESPLSGDAYLLLGIECVKLGDQVCALGAYTRALDLVWESDARAQAYTNRAELAMQKGDLGGAVNDYRRAVVLGKNELAVTLAYYGLGVALERSGDLPAALEVINTGTSVWPRAFLTNALDFPTVFFLPSYEIFYYKALVAMAAAERARTLGTEAERVQALEQAIARWREYLEPAEPRRERWVRNAQSHLGRLEQVSGALRSEQRARRGDETTGEQESAGSP